jgi:glycosyltransferase involved in cell wall biosynthesis
LKVAFVVQRCGREVNGGAESACLQIAQHLANRCEVDIITTCALDYMSWGNWYPAGAEAIGQTTVRRFVVDRPRNVITFNELSRELLSRKSEATTKEQEDWMTAQGPISASLLEYLRTHSNDYEAFIFFGYLYATTYFGLPSVADKSYLVPFAHDEWPIYLPMWERIFGLPKCLIFSTDAERRFLQKRFPRLNLSGPTIGVGVSAPENVDPTRFRRKYALNSGFLLYAGRIDASKGCDTLFEYFNRRQREACVAEKLVLIGKETMPVPFDDQIIYLGFLPDEERWDAMAACEWIVLPSPYESFSLALLETWSVGRPAIVSAACEVLVDHCRQANGGLWYSNFDEWQSILTVVPDAVRKALGRQGMDYVRRCYSWPRIENQYRSLLGL